MARHKSSGLSQTSKNIMAVQDREWKPTIATVILSILGVPIAYYLNKGFTTTNASAKTIFFLAVLVLGGITFLVMRIIPVKKKMYYGFSLFALTSVIDILIPLEIDGFITHFMDVYLQNGEPYLFSAWGALSAYWDGTFNLLCYIVMAHYASNGISYRSLAIVYSSNILNSMIVLLGGAFLSHTGLHPCTLLNIPYVLLPLYVLVDALSEPRQPQKGSQQSSVLHKLTALFLGVAAVFNIVRGLAALGSRVALIAWYRKEVEPLFNQTIPAPFVGVQGITGLFYFAPAMFTLGITLAKSPNKPWLKDLALVTFGAVLQTEVCLLGAEIHPLTDPEHGIPSVEDLYPYILHWVAHLSTLLAPLVASVVLFWCNRKGSKQVVKLSQMPSQQKTSSNQALPVNQTLSKQKTSAKQTSPLNQTLSNQSTSSKQIQPSNQTQSNQKASSKRTKSSNSKKNK